MIGKWFVNIVWFFNIVGGCAPVSNGVKKLNFSTWYGMYLKNEKVGYSEVKVKATSSGGYEIYELTYIELSMMGAKRNLKSISRYNTNSDFELQSFTFNLETEAQKVFARGEMQKSRLVGTIKTGAGKPGRKTQAKTITAKPPVYPITVLPMIAHKFTKSGIEINVFDPSIQVVNSATGKLLETSKDSIKVSITMMNGVSCAWVSREGKLLSETQPMGLSIIEEPRDKAMQIKEISPEILTLFSIKPELEIKNPRDVKLLKLLTSGLGSPSHVLTGERQRWFGDTLLIEVRGPMKSVGATSRLRKKYLEPTPFIQSNDERIIKLAQEIVGKSRDPWKKAAKLTNWVNENIQDMPTVSIPSALDVLESREGDCGEHTILFVALARACGIPATEVVGLVYVGDGFYYHAWAKVWAGRWVELDPTFGQPIADATHIALAEGGLEEQAKIMELVDKIKIEVLEYK